MWVCIPCSHWCASCIMESRNSGSGGAIPKPLKGNKRGKLLALSIHTQKILGHVWAELDSFAPLALLLWLTQLVVQTIRTEMLLLSQALAKGTFFLSTSACLECDLSLRVPHALCWCVWAAFGKAVVGDVFLRDEVCSGFSEESGRAEAANFSWPYDPWSICIPWPQLSPGAAGVQQHTIGLERLLWKFHPSIKR